MGGAVGIGIGIGIGNGVEVNPNGNVHVNGTAAAAGAAVPRRNSLGDLKIPARISQAQVSLRRDLGLVREFAASVERMSHMHFYCIIDN